MTEELKTISKRLLTIAEYVPVGSRLADIGTDHALLPTYLIQNQICTSIIAGEVNRGPFQAAVNQVKKEGLQDAIDVRMGNGLEVIQPDEVDVITISGMGGALITEIINDGHSKLNNVKRLILQPNVGEFTVREWFEANGWSLTDEQILEEDGKIYEVLVADQGDSGELYDHPVISRKWLLRLGPHLVQRKPSLLLYKWQHELNKLDRTIEQMGQSNLEETKLKRMEFEQERDELRGVLEWLQTGKPSSNGSNNGHRND